SGTAGSGIGSNLHLEVSQGVPNEIGYFLVGNEATSGAFISNGLLCLTSSPTAALYRYNVFGGDSNSVGLFDGGGDMQNLAGTSSTGTGFDVPLTVPASIPITIMSGDTWHFQYWYRDTPAGAGSSNFSNGLSVTFPTVQPAPPNVLFLIADDLTATSLGCYGNPDVITPNLDSLASRGMLFNNAYCQYPVCEAARASLFTGWYTQKIQANGGSFTSFDGALGANATLPEYFKLNGYTSSRVSKIYHMRVPGDITAGVAGPDHAPSWSNTFNALAPEWMTPGVTGHYTNETLNFNPTQHYNLGFGAAFYTVEASTSGAEQADELSAAQAMALLEGYQGDPFFLAVGLVRPHVPLVAPASIYSLYNANALPLAQSVPNDLADIPSQGVFWNEPSRGPNRPRQCV
ncbi:MAG: sulfatase-like hydrolase/transferase, partial [Planctomycetes bacterium]|nr:sulfatase-like hydrolase/transferase [Planctomycetota bacterium]